MSTNSEITQNPKRKLIVAAFLSMDGVVQAPGGPGEDPSGDFQLGGWLVPYTSDATGQAVMELLAQPFELLLGRRTYDIFAPYWSRVGTNSPQHAVAEPFNRVPKHVATHRPESLDWHNSRALGGDLVGAVRALKEQDGANLLTQGSAEVVRQLLAAGLVDELRLQIYPVVLGRGKRLFGDGGAEASAFTLEHSSSTPNGVLIARYVRSGEVRTGTFDETM